MLRVVASFATVVPPIDALGALTEAVGGACGPAVASFRVHVDLAIHTAPLLTLLAELLGLEPAALGAHLAGPVGLATEAVARLVVATLHADSAFAADTEEVALALVVVVAVVSTAPAHAGLVRPTVVRRAGAADLVDGVAYAPVSTL